MSCQLEVPPLNIASLIMAPQNNKLLINEKILINDFQVSSLVSSLNSSLPTPHNTNLKHINTNLSTARSKINFSTRVVPAQIRQQKDVLSTSRSVNHTVISSARSHTHGSQLLSPKNNLTILDPLSRSSDDQKNQLVLTHSPQISSLLADINNETIDTDTARLNKSKSMSTVRSTFSFNTSRSTSLNTNRSTTSLRHCPETTRSTFSTSSSTKSIRSALYTARSTTSSMEPKKLFMPWNSMRSIKRSTKTGTAPTSVSGQYRPWNIQCLSKKGKRILQERKGWRTSRPKGNVDLVAQTTQAMATSRTTNEFARIDALTIVDRETLAEEFNSLYNDSLVEKAARLQLSRGGRYIKHPIDSLRGPAALYLKAKGNVAVHVDPPNFSTLGKTLGDSANKTLHSTVAGKTTTAAETYVPQMYDASICIFKNVPSKLRQYLDASIAHDHELRGASLLVPKVPSFLKLQTSHEIKLRQDRAKKFQLVKELRDDHAKQLSAAHLKRKDNAHHNMKVKREDKERKLGRVPTGIRIGGGFSSQYRKLRRKRDAPSQKDLSLAAELQRRMNK